MQCGSIVLTGEHGLCKAEVRVRFSLDPPKFMSNHKVKIIRRVGIETTPGIKKRSEDPFELWELEIDDVKMEVLITQRDNQPGSVFKSQDVLHFSNNLVNKHPDYKEIREGVINKVTERYKVINNSGLRIDEPYPDAV